MAETSGTAGQDRLTITRTPADGISVIAVHGEIDHHTGDPLHRALTPHDGAGAPRIVVDLSGVTFMDSSGINILIAAHNAVRDAQGWLRLAGPTTSVLRTMQLVGLDEVIECYPTVGDALGA
ncbi:STAS domain-containing protein [Streptomyces sp. NPDC052701]|uniref:STAS domain-containing protein n=1 Tax=Streptomyces sp. NPDC052701 TaxID=3155533 RepID=UPI00344798CA